MLRPHEDNFSCSCLPICSSLQRLFRRKQTNNFIVRKSKEMSKNELAQQRSPAASSSALPEDVDLASQGAARAATSKVNMLKPQPPAPKPPLYEAKELVSGVVFMDDAVPVYQFLRDFYFNNEVHNPANPTLLNGDNAAQITTTQELTRDATARALLARCPEKLEEFDLLVRNAQIRQQLLVHDESPTSEGVEVGVFHAEEEVVLATAAKTTTCSTSGQNVFSPEGTSAAAVGARRNGAPAPDHVVRTTVAQFIENGTTSTAGAIEEEADDDERIQQRTASGVEVVTNKLAGAINAEGHDEDDSKQAEVVSFFPTVSSTITHDTTAEQAPPAPCRSSSSSSSESEAGPVTVETFLHSPSKRKKGKRNKCRITSGVHQHDEDGTDTGTPHLTVSTSKPNKLASKELEYDLVVSKGTLRICDDAICNLILQTAMISTAEETNEGAGAHGETMTREQEEGKENDGGSDANNNNPRVTVSAPRHPVVPRGARLTLAMKDAEVLIVSSSLLIITFSSSTFVPPVVAPAPGAGSDETDSASDGEDGAQERRPQREQESEVQAAPQQEPLFLNLPRILYGLFLHQPGLLSMDELTKVLRNNCNCCVLEPRYDNSSAELFSYWTRFSAFHLGSAIRTGAQVVAKGIQFVGEKAREKDWVKSYEQVEKEKMERIRNQRNLSQSSSHLVQPNSGNVAATRLPPGAIFEKNHQLLSFTSTAATSTNKPQSETLARNASGPCRSQTVDVLSVAAPGNNGRHEVVQLPAGSIASRGEDAAPAAVPGAYAATTGEMLHVDLVRQDEDGASLSRQNSSIDLADFKEKLRYTRDTSHWLTDKSKTALNALAQKARTVIANYSEQAQNVGVESTELQPSFAAGSSGVSASSAGSASSAMSGRYDVVRGLDQVIKDTGTSLETTVSAARRSVDGMLVANEVDHGDCSFLEVQQFIQGHQTPKILDGTACTGADHVSTTSTSSTSLPSRIYALSGDATSPAEVVAEATTAAPSRRGGTDSRASVSSLQRGSSSTTLSTSTNDPPSSSTYDSTSSNLFVHSDSCTQVLTSTTSVATSVLTSTSGHQHASSAAGRDGQGAASSFSSSCVDTFDAPGGTNLSRTTPASHDVVAPPSQLPSSSTASTVVQTYMHEDDLKQAAKTVGLSSVLAGVEIVSAMYDATSEILSSTANVTADLVGHRYGEDAHQIAKDSVQIAQNVLHLKEQFSGKAVVSQVAKETLT
ncbi:unnamed protein product [Amoebophrya sp. A120]|nr:unnamed protein product [Amoebophrya sp. A120]|eukprot:GSA120T00007676001.1